MSRQQQPVLADEELHDPADRPHLPCVLLPPGGGRPIPGARPGVEDDAVAVAGDPHGNHDVVVQRVGGDRLEEAPPDRVDRAGRADRRVQRALRAPDELLVAPVGADAVTHRGRRVVEEQELAAGGADAVVGEVLGEPAHGVGLVALPGVAEHDDRPPAAGNGVVEDRRLAATPRVGQHPDGRAGEGRTLVATRHVDGAVGGAVGGDHDFQPVGPVVELQAVLDPPGDRFRLVVGGDEHRDRWLDRSALHRSRHEATEQPDERGVPDEGVDEHGEGEPEEDLHHGALTAPQRARCAAGPRNRRRDRGRRRCP